MLTAKKYLGGSKWLCVCECGRECIVASAFLNEIEGRNKIKSCGCLREKNVPEKEEFFEVINSESKSYILGFIAAGYFTAFARLTPLVSTATLCFFLCHYLSMSSGVSTLLFLSLLCTDSKLKTCF